MSYRLLLFAAIAYTAAFKAHASCAVVRDDGRLWVNKSINSCEDLFHPDHFCASRHAQTSKLCGLLAGMVSPQWDAPQDIVISPHRGVWGHTLPVNSSHDPNASNPIIAEDDKIPQNSLHSTQAAHTAGYTFIELDFVLNWNYPDPLTKGEVYLSHFFDLYGSTDYDGNSVGTATGSGFLANTSPTDVASLAPLTLRSTLTRQVDTTNHLNKLSTLDELMRYINSLPDPKPVILIDPKWAKKYQAVEFGGAKRKECVWFCTEPFSSSVDFYKQQYIEIIKQVLASARKYNLLQNIIVKAPRKMIDKSVAITLTDWEKVLWSPQPNPSTSFAENQAYIEGWRSIKNSVAFVETVVPSEDNWTAKPISYSGKNYADLSDLIKDQFDRRMGVWVISERSQWGNASAYFPGVVWLGSFPGGRNGEYIWSIKQLKWGQHAVVTTDKPGLYTKIRALMQPF